MSHIDGNPDASFLNRLHFFSLIQIQAMRKNVTGLSNRNIFILKRYIRVGMRYQS